MRLRGLSPGRRPAINNESVTVEGVTGVRGLKVRLYRHRYFRATYSIGTTERHVTRARARACTC